MENVLSLVDLAGSQERYNRYVESVKNTLPSQQRKDSPRYWSIYEQLMRKFLIDPAVTNKRSILSCMYNAPKLGLNPDPVFGQIYFIPYKGVLTYQLGYKGMVRLSLNTGKVINVRSGLVYEADEWDYFEDEKGQHYLHRPHFGKDRGQEVCGYSIFTDNNNIPNIHVMESYHIDAIKEMVLARMRGRKTPWENSLFEPEMRKKTVTRRHWKLEPMSAEIAEAITHEELTEAGETISKEEHERIIDEILTKGAVQKEDDFPDPQSEEGKKLSAELDSVAASQEQLPFN